MRAAVLLIGFGALMPDSASAAEPPRDVSALSWIAGDWAEEKEGRWTEESWSRPRGGMMLGTSLSGRGARAADWEFMRIASDENGVTSFWGSPRGKPGVPFRLVSVGAREAVFENPRHDYPVRIVYRREGRTLVATISGPGGANPMSWRYRRR